MASPTEFQITDVRPPTPDEARNARLVIADAAVRDGWVRDLPDVLSMLGLA